MLMLWQPRRCRFSIIWASVSTVSRSPWRPWLVCQLMQKTQRRLQCEKNTVPEPPRPTSGRSSPKCAWYPDTTSSGPAPQYPFSPSRRRAPHSRGQRLHARIRSRSCPPRLRSSPSAWSLRYGGSNGAAPAPGLASPASRARTIGRPAARAAKAAAAHCFRNALRDSPRGASAGGMSGRDAVFAIVQPHPARVILSQTGQAGEGARPKARSSIGRVTREPESPRLNDCRTSSVPFVQLEDQDGMV